MTFSMTPLAISSTAIRALSREDASIRYLTPDPVANSSAHNLYRAPDEAARTPMKKLTTLAKKKLVIAALEDIKAHDIQAIDVRKITSIFDWIVVASADSARQTKALVAPRARPLKEAGSVIVGTEGEESGDWILVDAGDVVAHVMQPAVRTSTTSRSSGARASSTRS
jgi:ribosome-associated protein